MSPTAIPGNLILKNEMVEADPFFDKVSLLLHGDGANGSTTIVDSSPLPKTVTVFGDAQISTAQSKFGGASIAFDGTGDCLGIPSIVFGTNESFTLEAWLYKTARDGSGYTNVFGGSGVQIGFDLSTEGSVFMYFAGGFSVSASGTSMTSNTWNHVAWVRNVDACAIYVNGILTGSGTRGNSFPLIVIGALSLGGSYEMNGYIDDLRITKGVARYTSNFTPPTAPFSEVWG